MLSQYHGSRQCNVRITRVPVSNQHMLLGPGTLSPTPTRSKYKIFAIFTSWSWNKITCNLIIISWIFIFYPTKKYQMSNSFKSNNFRDQKIENPLLFLLGWKPWIFWRETNRGPKKFSLCLNSKSMREKREGEKGQNTVVRKDPLSWQGGPFSPLCFALATLPFLSHTFRVQA